MRVFEYYVIDELEVVVVADFQQGYPPPMTRNPDSPGFSDPGQPDELNDVRVYLEGSGGYLDLTDYLPPKMYEQIIEEVLLAVQEGAE